MKETILNPVDSSIAQPPVDFVPGVPLSSCQECEAHGGTGQPEIAPSFSEIADSIEVGPRLQERFAAHVEDIRTKGDALDRLRVFGRSTLGLRSGLPFAVLASPVLATTNRLTEASLFALAVVPPLAGSIKQMRNAFLAEKAVGRWLQEELNERFEIYKIKGDKERTPAMALRYYGPLDETDPAHYNPNVSPEAPQDLSKLQRVQRIAALAKESDVDLVVLGHQFAKSLIGDKDNVILPAKALLDEKGIRLDKDAYLGDAVVGHQPDFWLNLTEQKQQAKIIKHIDGLVDKLRLVDPDHPLVELKDAYDKPLKAEEAKVKEENHLTDEQWNEFILSRDAHGRFPAHRVRSQKMVAAAKRHVQREWGDNLIEKPRRVDVAFGADPRPTRISMEANLEGDHIVWTSNGQFLRRKNVAELLDFDKSVLAELIRDPGAEEADKPQIFAYLRNHPEASATMLAALIAKRVRQEEEKTATPFYRQAESDGTEGMSADFSRPTIDTLLTSEQIGHWGKVDNFYGGRSVRKRNVAKAGIAAGALVVTAFTSLALTAKIETDTTDAVNAAFEQVPASEDGGVQEKAEAIVADQNPVMGAWIAIKDAVKAAEELMPQSESAPTDYPSAGMDGQRGVIDNIESGNSPTASWSIESHGLSTQGYWTQSLSNYMELTDQGIQWSNTEEPEESHYIGLPTVPDSVANTVEVDTTVQGGELEYGNGYFKIPVLDSTRPIAANINGKPTAFVKMTDGTYGLAFPKGESGVKGQTVTYWLGTDGDDQNLPVAVQPLHVFNEQGVITEAEADAIRREWDKVIPGFSQMDPYDQVKVMGDYIDDNFNYRLKPFPDSFDRDTTDPSAYTQRMLKLGAGFCASTNSLTALATIGLEYNINLANGYLIQDENATVLRSNQAHAWNVDQWGIRQDHTPDNNILPEDAAFLNAQPEKPEKEDQSGGLPLIPIGIALTAVAAVVEGSRRREQVVYAGRKVTALTADLVDRQLTKLNPVTLHQTAAVSDELLYSPARDVAAALERGRREAAESVSGSTRTVTLSENLVDKLLRYAPRPLPKTAGEAEAFVELPHEAANVEGEIKFMADRTPDRRLARQLRKIGRVLGAVRFVNQHPHPEKPKKVRKSFFQAKIK